MRHFSCASVLVLASLTAVAHPGSGIVAVSDTAAITGDALTNGIWRFEVGKDPARLAPKFHCHWVTKGRDGHLYAESLGERGGAWETSIYRLDARGAAKTPVASSVDSVHGVFLVDVSGEIVHQAGDKLVVDLPGGGMKPFRGSGRPAEGVRRLSGIKGLAWGPDGSLYASDGDRILRAGSDGVLREVAKLEGKVVDPLYGGVDERAIAWGLAVDDRSAIFAAAPALGKVLRIAVDGKQDVISRSEDGWAAIGVAVSGRAVFLLESKTTERDNFGPRVKLLPPGGPARLVGTINGDR